MLHRAFRAAGQCQNTLQCLIHDDEETCDPVHHCGSLMCFSEFMDNIRALGKSGNPKLLPALGKQSAACVCANGWIRGKYCEARRTNHYLNEVTVPYFYNAYFFWPNLISCLRAQNGCWWEDCGQSCINTGKKQNKNPVKIREALYQHLICNVINLIMCCKY